ncbi:hypothetical protein QUF70_14170 [Desulfobacterales bacterium HSG17]|nr:hypothetical protein [Desulfobacterales bacterium HSG17]
MECVNCTWQGAEEDCKNVQISKVAIDDDYKIIEKKAKTCPKCGCMEFKKNDE